MPARANPAFLLARSSVRSPYPALAGFRQALLALARSLKNLGYKITGSDQKNNSNISYAYCSDTTYEPLISDKLKNINILYHESTFLEKHVHLAKKTKHSTALQASKIAKAANVTILNISKYHGLC